MPAKKKYDDILEQARQHFKSAYDADQDERKKSLEDTRFAIDDDGCQWDKDVRAIRESDNPPRPCLSLNKIPEKIDQVEGEFRQLRPSFKIRGVDAQSDPIIADIYSGMLRHIEYNSSARSAYNTSHTSVLYGGRGAWRIDIEDDEDDPFVRNIKINRIPNPLTVYWDPLARKEDKSDAKYMFVTEETKVKEFEAKYPNVSVADFSGNDTSWSQWRTKDTIRVAEYWWKEEEDKTFYRVTRMIHGVPTTITVCEDPEDSEESNAQRYLMESDEVIEKKVVKVPVIKWAMMTAGEIIPHPDTDEKINKWPGKYIPIIVELGKTVNIQGEEKSRGMVRHARTPQQMYNYFSSVTTEQALLIPKAPYLMTATMMGKYQSMWDQANTRNFMYLLYDADPAAPTGMPKREIPPQLSTAYAEIKAQMEHDIMSGMGIYQASLGDAGQEKSGRAILARQRQGNIGSYTFTDKFQSSYVYSTKVIIDLIPYVYDTEMVMRIRGEDDVEKTVPINARPDPINPGRPAIPMDTVDDKLLSKPREGITQYINDLTVGKYDIAVTIGPSYTTQREEAAEVLNDLIKGLPPQQSVVLTDLLIKNLDMPQGDEAAERLKKMMPAGIIEQDGEQPITPQQVEQAMLRAVEEFKNTTEGQRIQADISGKQVEIQKKTLDFEQEKLKIQSEREKQDHDRRMRELDNQAKIIQLEIEKIRLEKELAPPTRVGET